MVRRHTLGNALGKVADGRDFHGHGLSVIIHMINTAVHDTVILALVLLGIHYPGHITAARRGQETACFQGNASLNAMASSAALKSASMASSSTGDSPSK